MGKLIKWLLGIVLVLVILVVAAVIVLPLLIDPNEHKDDIIAAVKEQTGRDLQITQELTLSVFPWLGIETGGVSLSNAKGFGDEPFAQVEQLGLRVKLLPLISRRVEVDTLVLDGLRLNLAKDAQGTSNWADLQAHADAEEKPAEAPGADDRGGPLALKIQGIQLNDARVTWRDAQTGEHYVLQDLRLVSGSLEPGVQVPLKAGFRLASRQPKLDLQMQMQADVTVDAAFSHYQISSLELALQGKGEGLPEDGMNLNLDTDIDLDLAEGRVQLIDLQLSGPALSASGNLQVADMHEAPKVSGAFKLGETNLKQLAALFGAHIETADPKALTSVSADLRLAHDGKALKIEPLQVRLDDTRLSGQVHLLDPQGPVLRSKLQIDALDVDRYLAPAAEAGAEGEAAPAASSEDPFAALRRLDLQAEVRIGQLTVNKARMSDVLVKIVSKGGVLKLDPMAAKLYEGTFDGSLTLDARQRTPRLHAVEQLKGIQIGALLRDVLGEDRLLGKGELHLDLRTTGLSETEVRNSLNGSGRFRFVDGAFKGVNIAQLLRTAGSKLGLSEPPAAGSANQTDFTEMSGSVTVSNGVVSNQDLQAKSPLLRIDGKGTVNLPADTIDYRLTTELVKSLEGQGGRERDQLAGVPIPVKIQGPLASPSYKPDLEGVLSAKAKQRIEEEKQKARAKLEAEAKKALEGKLKGLFGR